MSKSKKHGKCPFCKGSVKRQGKRLDGRRTHVVAPHWTHGVYGALCMGSEMPWPNQPKERFKITLEEISCNNNL